MNETEIVNTAATEAPKSFDQTVAPSETTDDAVTPTALFTVGDIAILRGHLVGETFMPMTVENVIDTADDAVFIEVAWIAEDGCLQRATFDLRALATIDELAETRLGDLAAATHEDVAPPKPRRGRPPGTKNKRKRKASKR